MGPDSDQQLLRAYASSRSEEAFAELVRRYLDLVYSVGMRLTRDHHLAEDVAQCVFQALARQAATLADRASLAGWLHTTSRHMAAQLVRGTVRRRHREQAASEIVGDPPDPESEAIWKVIDGHLDAALSELGDADREAILLRYFRRCSAREAATEQGVTAEAAQKRVHRAVERLRDALAARGISAEAAALAFALSGGSVPAAPASLAATITSVALATAGWTGVAGSASVSALLLTPFQKAAMVATLVCALGFGLVTEWRSAAWRRQVGALKAERETAAEEAARWKASQDELQARLRDMEATVAEARSNHLDLLRLRGEVGRLRDDKRLLEGRIAALGSRPSAPAMVEHSRPPEPAPSPASPFQLRLVVEPTTEDSETLPMPGPADVPGAESRLSVGKIPLLDHTMVQAVEVRTNSDAGHPQIEIQFTDRGRDEFARVTREHVNQRLAITLDGRVYSAPVIRDEIRGGKAVVTGSFSAEEAVALAARINLAVGAP